MSYACVHISSDSTAFWGLCVIVHVFVFVPGG